MGSTAHERRTLPYSVSKLSVIRSAIAGYEGGAAILRELIQNADDARASYLYLTVTPEGITIENDSIFSDDDFNAIANLASGNKRYDPDTTGTWGTGFLSVYQICDYPELQSAGSHVRFDPESDSLPMLDSPITDRSVFYFPWRRERTQIAREIEAEVWTDDRIEAFVQEAIGEMYRAILFLRHVQRLTITATGHDGDQLRLYAVSRERLSRESLRGNIIKERWRVLASAEGEQREDLWFIYRGRFSAGGYAPDGRVIKRPDIAFAHGTASEWLGRPLTGWLYNTLPTTVETGFTFQINGDFFPDANRRDILTDGEKGNWNRAVLRGIADLFAASLESVRDDCPQSDAFHRLFPLKPRSHAFDVILHTFKRRARETAIVQTTDGQWAVPSTVRLPDPTLSGLVEDYIPALAPPELPPELRRFFQEMGARPFRLADLLRYLSETITDGTLLGEADPILSDRARLDLLWERLSDVLLRRRGAGEGEELALLLRKAPILLDAQGRLRTKDAEHGPWRVDETTRTLFPAPDRMLDPDFQASHEQALAVVVDEMSVRHVVAYLNEIAPTSVKRPLTRAHDALNSWEKLTAVLDYLISRHALSECEDLRGLPLCVDESEVLHTIGDAPWLVLDEGLREILGGANLTWMHPKLRREKRYADFLHSAGVRRLDPTLLISLLETWFPERQPIDDVPPPFNDPSRLRALYAFFHRYESTLDEEARGRLKQLPFIVTQQGNVAPAHGPDLLLSLPPRGSGDGGFIDVLHLDNLVSDQVLDDATRPFFTGLLGLRELTLASYVESYIPAHYLHDNLSHADRLQLLALVREAMRRVPQDGRERLVEKLRDCPLIRCRDDKYRPAREVYFPSDLLNSVFPYEYPRPHPSYGIAQGRTGSTAGAELVASEWYSCFQALGMRTLPLTSDLLESVRQITRVSPPTSESIDQIGRIYRFLADHWHDYKNKQQELSPLREWCWLPALNRPDRWFRPRNLYSASLRALVESQAPVLPFGDVQADIASFLGIKTHAEPRHVVQHLLWLSERGGKPTAQIYQFLGHLDPHELTPLRNKPVIYDDRSQRWWLPRHTYFGDHSADFGAYRCYLDPIQVGSAQPLFQALGVRSEPDPIHDYVELLLEIADKHRERAVSEEDQPLLYRAYRQLTTQLDPDLTPEECPRWLSVLRQTPVVLCRDSRLRHPSSVLINDQPKWAKKFDETSVRFARFDDESVRPFLVAIGVRGLSSAVQRQLVRVSRERHDRDYTQKIRALTPGLRRIAAHYRSGGMRGWTDLSRLDELQVYQADTIEIRYVIDGRPRVQGFKESVDAFYDEASHRLYRHANVPPPFAIARELVNVLNPAADPAALTPLLEKLIDTRLDQIDAILDQYEIARVEAPPPPAPASRQADDDVFAQVPVVDAHDGDEERDAASRDLEPNTRITTAPRDARVNARPRPQPECVVTEHVSDEFESDQTADSSRDDTPQRPPAGAIHLEQVDSAGSTTVQQTDGAVPESSTGAIESIPPFAGQIRPTVPVIPTNWARLRARYGAEFVKRVQNEAGEEGPYPDTVPELPGNEPGESRDFQVQSADQAWEVGEVRFVLTYQNRYEGFLPLSARARALLRGTPRCITCITDFGERITLYVDYEQQVIYNQDDLPRFFAAHDIPAGGIVYLARQHGNTYRFYYRLDPRVVHNVVISEVGDDGTIRYYTTDVTVECEIDEDVFRAEKRLEDQPSLIIEAHGKRSVLETVIELFENAEDRRLRISELRVQLNRIRRVADSTLTSLLRKYSCFVEEGDGYWRFVPDHGLASYGSQPGGRQRSPEITDRGVRTNPLERPSHPQGAMQLAETQTVAVRDARIAGCAGGDPVELVVAVNQRLRMLRSTEFSAITDQLWEALRELKSTLNALLPDDHVEAVASPIPIPEPVQAVLARLRNHAGDQEAGKQLREWVRARVDTPDNDLVHDTLLATVLEQVGPVPVEAYVLPVLEAAVDVDVSEHRFDQARALTQLIEQVAGISQAERRARIDRCEQAYELFELAGAALSEEEELETLRDALDLNPDLAAARKRAATVLQKLLEADAETIAKSLSEGDIASTITIYDRARRRWAAWSHLNEIQARATPLLELIWSRVFQAAHDYAQQLAETGQPQEILNAYHRVAELYHSVPAERRGHDRVYHDRVYLEALDELGQAYLTLGECPAAIACWSQAVDFWLRVTKVGVPDRDLRSIRERLARVWEDVGLWDYARDVWHQIGKSTSRPSQVSAWDRWQRAQERAREVAEVRAARDRFINDLTRFRDDAVLGSVLEQGYLDKLIQRESHRLKQ